MEGAWSRSGVPARFRDVEPADAPIGWAYIWGPVGSGKTRAACRALRRHLEDGTREVCPGLWSAPVVKLVTSAGYLGALRDAMDGDSQVASVARGAAMLVLDDLGQENPTPWACEQVFELVNARYNAMRPLVVTSQFPPQGIAARLAANGGREKAEAVASRLIGECRVYGLRGRDRRLEP